MKKFMNFFLMATLVALCVGFSSCSKDDDEGGKSESIVGNWRSTYYYDYYGYRTISEEDQYPFNFKAGGTLETTDPKLESFTKWEITEKSEDYIEFVIKTSNDSESITGRYFFPSTGILAGEWEKTGYIHLWSKKGSVSAVGDKILQRVK
jgi:hypothetical protein